MAYRAAICDDSAADCKYIRKLISEWAQERNITVNAEEFPSAESFLFRYAENKTFDLLLLDIEMDGMGGVTMAKRIRRGNEAVQII